jgi:HK97 family phage major capsid protein
MRTFSPLSVTSMIRSAVSGQNTNAVLESVIEKRVIKKYGHGVWGAAGHVLPPRAAIRDLTAGSASAGGDLVGQSIARVANSVRPTFKLEAAGMQVKEISEGLHSLPRFVAAVGGMIAESGTAPSLTSTVTTVDLTPKTACARLGYSRRFNLLTEDAEAVVLEEISRAVSSLINAQVIAGTGSSNEMQGLLHLPDAQTVSYSQATPTLTELSNQLEKLGDSDVDLDAESVCWLMHPSDLRDLLIAEQVSSSGEMIMRWHEGSYRLFGKRVLTSTSVTEGKHLLLDAQFANLVFFGPPQIIVDRFSSGKSLDGSTEIVVLNNADFGSTYQSSVVIGGA